MKKVCLLMVCVLTWSVQARDVTLLYTNDIESVYEPVEAHWRDDIERMGGMAYLSTLIKQQRAAVPVSLLFDAGDIFTGSLSRATEGRLVFDIYSAMGYDAVNLGNHEFEYGWQILHRVMQRARFPVLNANIFHEGSDINFARQYAILETEGVRVGVIGLMGIDAFVNTMMKSNRQGLYARPPVEVVQPLVDEIRHEVDLVVLLTHQNRTAPMQTDKESDPMVRRGFDEDYALAGAVAGVDLIVGGHSDNGLPEPVCHPDTGTCIVMTFGQGMHLGSITFELQGSGARMKTGQLIPVDAGLLAADTRIENLIADARSEHPELASVITELDRQASRRYYRESDLGNLLADAIRHYAGTNIGLMPAGAIRADLEAGPVTREEVLNVFPFTDRVSVLKVSGEVLRQVLEKSLALEYGLVQFSGIRLTYNSEAAIGERLLEAWVGDQPLDETAVYSLVTGSFTATGGENYQMFEGLPLEISDVLISDALISEFGKNPELVVPPSGRQADLAAKNK